MNITKRAYAVMAGLLVTAGTVAYSTNQPYHVSGADEPVIVQQVNRHEEQLANHEARLSNVESDVAAVQTQTNSTPSTQRVEVPAVSAPAAAPAAAAPTPTVVDSYYCSVTIKHKSFITEITNYLVSTYSDGKIVAEPTTYGLTDGNKVEPCAGNEKPGV